MKNACGGVCCSLPAAVDAVDGFCAGLRGSLLAGIPPGERFAVELLLREALLNAVVHGAKNELDSEVRCVVKRVPGGMKIQVCDSGEGFDWRGWRRRFPVPSAPSGRGLHILYLYASKVRFNRKGNRVELTRTFRKGDGNDGLTDPA